VGRTKLSGMDMTTLATRYIARRGGKANTKRAIKCVVMEFARWWDQTRRAPENMGRPDIENYLYEPYGLVHNQRSKYTDCTVTDSRYNTKLTHLKGFIDWLTDQDDVKMKHADRLIGPFKKAVRTVSERPKRRLTIEQIDYAVNSCPNPWERWVTAYAFLSMGREGEMLDRTLNHVKLDESRMEWERPKVLDHDDRLPMMNKLMKEYRRWREYYESVCPDITGDSYVIPARDVFGSKRKTVYYPDRHPTNIGKVIKEAAARALGTTPDMLPNQAAHIARRSGARVLYDQLLAAGVPDPIRIVQALLGHKHQNMTERYIGIEGDRERRDKVLIGSDFMDFGDGEDNVVQLSAAS
jgi:integrase